VVANLAAIGKEIDGEVTAGDTDTFKLAPPPPRDIVQIKSMSPA
jgi:hypothetical protein